MNSIRVRVIVMLVSSVLGVVILASAAMSRLVFELVDQNFRNGLTERVSAFSHTITFSGKDAVFHLQDEPVEGEILEHPTALLKEAFRKAGNPFEIFVKRMSDGRIMASIHMGPGWLSWPVPDNSPPSTVWYGLAGWMALIAVGVVGVALAVSMKTTKQLKFLEAMAGSVGKNGELPTVPEEGSAEIRATARALNTMGRNLKKAMDSKIRLVAAAGHDLRTPMTRMRLRAEFLSELERNEWLHDLDEMDKIADSTIQLVREETVNKGTDIIRLDELVATICKDLNDIKLPVKWLDGDGASIRTSPIALTRALRNLIINAATHGGGAMVSVSAVEGGSQVVIDDNGPGIPEGSLESAFEPFFRVDPARRQPIPGAGLGLAIAKEIVERQGGSLTIENRHPHGLRQILFFEALPAEGELLREVDAPAYG